MTLARWIAVLCLSLSVASPLVQGQTTDPALNALWGKDITVGELVLATAPEELAGMSDLMRNTKVTWGEIGGTGPRRFVTHYVGPDGGAAGLTLRGLLPGAAGAALLIPVALFLFHSRARIFRFMTSWRTCRTERVTGERAG